MTYHVNASSRDGAVSEPALTLVGAQALADEFKAKGYMSVVIVDAGSGAPVRSHLVATMKAGSADAETQPSSFTGDNASSHETNDLFVALQETADDQQPLKTDQKPASAQESK